MIALYINNLLIDLIGTEVVAFDFGSFSIATPAEREGLRSYSFSLPKTNNNKKAFANPERLDNVSILPFSQIQARLFVDGVDIGVRFCELVSVNASYNIRLYGANSDIFATLKNVALTDLDLTDLNHYWNLQNVFNSRHNTKGYIYPIINYSDDAPNQIMDNLHAATPVDFMLPALFLDDILHRIFAAIGYTLVNENENDPLYVAAQIILPASQYPSLPPGAIYADKYKGSFSISQDIRIGGPETPRTAFEPDTYLTPNNYYQLPYSQGATLLFQDDISFVAVLDFIFDSPVAQNVLIQVATSQTSLSLGPFPLIAGLNELVVQFDAVELKLPTSNIGDYTNGFLSVTVINLKEDVITLKAGSKITITECDVTTSNIILFGEFIEVGSVLPSSMTQGDLLSQYMQMFCMLMQVDEANKTVTLFNFNKTKFQLSQAYDWSKKVDYTNEPEVTFVIDDYAQANKFLYTIDGDETQPIGTDGEIDINNTNLDVEKDVVTLKFASTYTQILMKGLTINTIGVFDATVAQNQKQPRILCLKKLQGLEQPIEYFQTFRLDDSLFAYDDIPLTWFIDANQDFNLGFANNLILRYFSALRDVMGNVKIVDIPIRLTAADISQLDFSRPVYIDKYDSYFYINKITAFTASSRISTIVELVKLNIYG